MSKKHRKNKDIKAATAYKPTYTTDTICHHIRPVFKCEDVTFFGGSWRWDEPEKWEGVLIDLDDRIKPLVEITGFSQEIRERLSPPAPDTIRITWPDFGVPTLDRDFWLKLTEALLDFKKDVLVTCFSGHGRTGTCLTIIAGILGVKDPVGLIREKLCSKCIETKSQMEYAARVTGLIFSESKPYYGYPLAYGKDVKDEDWWN